MFKKRERLTKKEFDWFFKVGKKYHFPLGTFIVAPASGLQVAVVVGKKVSKKAVLRNLYRRRIYNILYRELKLKRSIKNKTVIFIVRPPITSLSKKEGCGVLMKIIAEVFESA